MILSLPFSSFADGSRFQIAKFHPGTYRGSYYANQGHTGLTLKVYVDEEFSIKG